MVLMYNILISLTSDDNDDDEKLEKKKFIYPKIYMYIISIMRL